MWNNIVLIRDIKENIKVKLKDNIDMRFEGWRTPDERDWIKDHQGKIVTVTDIGVTLRYGGDGWFRLNQYLFCDNACMIDSIVEDD